MHKQIILLIRTQNIQTLRMSEMGKAITWKMSSHKANLKNDLLNVITGHCGNYYYNAFPTVQNFVANKCKILTSKGSIEIDL